MLNRNVQNLRNYYFDNLLFLLFLPFFQEKKKKKQGQHLATKIE